MSKWHYRGILADQTSGSRDYRNIPADRVSEVAGISGVYIQSRFLEYLRLLEHTYRPGFWRGWDSRSIPPDQAFEVAEITGVHLQTRLGVAGIAGVHFQTRFLFKSSK